MKAPLLTRIIKGAAARSGYSMRQLARETGIPYQTIMQNRLSDPGSWRLCEIWAIVRVLEFTDDELMEVIGILRKGGKKIA